MSYLTSLNFGKVVFNGALSDTVYTTVVCVSSAEEGQVPARSITVSNASNSHHLIINLDGGTANNFNVPPHRVVTLSGRFYEFRAKAVTGSPELSVYAAY